MAGHGKYDDIIDLPHHVSLTRPRMSMEERAAQFSAFAALSGHDEAIKETWRVTSEKIELSEDEKEVLDWTHQLILFALEREERPLVTMTYFQPDPRKEGGEYLIVTGEVEGIDNNAECFCLADGKRISFDAIIKIDLSQ